MFGSLRGLSFSDALPEDALRKVEQETREVGDGALVFKALDLQSQQLVSGCEVSVLADWT